MTHPLCNSDLQELQQHAEPAEEMLSGGEWYGFRGFTCLLKYLFPRYAKLTHEFDHVKMVADELIFKILVHQRFINLIYWECLGIYMKRHSGCHPVSAGAVERENVGTNLGKSMACCVSVHDSKSKTTEHIDWTC